MGRVNVEPADPPASVDSPPSDEQRLIDFLADRDEPCPQCGYNLRNLQSGRCPECGQAICLAVALVEPYLKAWIAMLAALCAGGGIGMLWIAGILFAGMLPAPMLAPIFVHIVMIPLVFVAIARRRAFLRLSRERQWLLAGTTLGLFVLVTGAFFVIAR
jgi:hypothetical protein